MPGSRLVAAWRNGHWKGVADEKLAVSAICLLLVAVLLSLTVTVLSLRNSSLAAQSSRSRALENAARINDLTAKLQQASEQLEINRQTDQQRTDCTLRYNDLVDSSFRAYVSGIGDIVVAVGSSSPAPAEDRKIALAGAVTKLDGLNEQARQVSMARQAYFDQGRPLPCPLDAARTP
jgi:hypothetical protein